MAEGQSDKSKPGWPAGVQSISFEGLDHLGVGDDGQLYWRGQKVKTASNIELTTEQGIGAWLLIASAVVLALIEVVRVLGYGH